MSQGSPVERPRPPAISQCRSRAEAGSLVNPADVSRPTAANHSTSQHSSAVACPPDTGGWWVAFVPAAQHWVTCYAATGGGCKAASTSAWPLPWGPRARHPETRSAPAWP